MKIRTHFNNLQTDVFCIYWVETKRQYLTIDIEKFEGVDIYNESDSDLIEENIDNFVLRKGSDGLDILIHKALSEGDIFDRIVDWDNEAAEIFFERLKSLSAD